ncbi:MAG: superoxide dismutase family protein [Bacteroidetes bacterium]|nr:superoxide dismutase family protein [Bacteroidota bacterium]
MKKILFSFFVFSLLLAGCKNERMDYTKKTEIIDKAVAVLQPLNGSSVSGIVYFKEKGGTVEVIADVKGLTPGEHGFHIHTFGDLRANDGSLTGGHFNPTNMKHGGPATEERHIGDLGNILALDDSTAQYVQDKIAFTINGTNSILGRSVVIHSGEDDFKTQPTGNSGTKIAAGIIGIQNYEQ